MAIFKRTAVGTDPNEVAHDAALGGGGRTAAAVSAVALLFSGFSLWDTSLKSSDLKVYVPPVIQYAAPYQNSNFEMIAVPVTITNEGARTGTVLSMELEVVDPRKNLTKRFYAADFGRWTMEKTRAGAYEPFAPISLAGRTSRTENVLFYTRGDEEKVQELVRELGPYKLTLKLEQAASEGGWFDKLWASGGDASVTFERELRWYDGRSFNNGTIPLYAKDWRSSSNAKP